MCRPPSRRPSPHSLLVATLLASAMASGTSAQTVVGSPLQQAHEAAHGKGANYIVNTTNARQAELQFLGWDNLDDVGAPLPGTYSRPQVHRELLNLKTLGVRSVRVWGSYWGWRVDRDEYVDCLQHFATVCASLDLRVTFCIWSTTFEQVGPIIVSPSLSGEALHDLLTTSHETRIQAATLWDGPFEPDPGETTPLGFLGYADSDVLDLMGEPWQMSWRSEPGYANVQFFNAGISSALNQSIDSYLDDLALVFSSLPLLDVVFDLCNEVDAEDPSNAITQDWLDFLDHTEARILAGFPPGNQPGITVSLAFVDTPPGIMGANLAALDGVVDQTEIAFHDYFPTGGAPDAFLDKLDAAVAYAQPYGLPLVCSEFYGPHYSDDVGLGTLEDAVAHLQSRNVPGDVWGALSSNSIYDWGNSDDPDNLIGFMHMDGLWRTQPPTLPNWPPYDPLAWSAVQVVTGFPTTTAEADDQAAFLAWQ